jgi:vacuolar-type H+-ATPase subunit F/Vma7
MAARVAALGERAKVQGFGLAGALVLVAEDPAAVRNRWRALPDDVEVVILTPAAAAALAGRVEERFTAVMPS